jgi:hypothetical protein
MMKKIKSFLVLFLLCCSVLQAQQKKNPVNNQPPKMTGRDTLLCNYWQLDSVEQFSVKGKPEEMQKNDAALFMLDKTAEITLDGKTVKGTWVPDRNRNYINIASADGTQKIHLKIMNVTKEGLIVENQDEHLLRTIYYFKPGKK